jgi:hypothetical protein
MLALTLQEEFYEQVETPCPHLSTHREEAFGSVNWNPFTQDAEDPTYMVEVCDDCDEQLFNEMGDDCEN